jgi:LmbE family N-acetylglucosaminyl deacetylase
MMTQDRVPPRRALFIAAHPDDTEFAAAGTAAKWAQAGTRVRYVLVTSGDIGSLSPSITHEELARIREAEQLAAARVIGMDENDVVYLGYRDGQVPEELLRKWAVKCGKSAGLAHAEAFRWIILSVGLTVEGLEEHP